MENNISDLNEALKLIQERRLLKAIDKVKAFLDIHPLAVYIDELHRIDNDYALMLDYMKRGYADPSRETVYEKLLNRLGRLIQDLLLEDRKLRVGIYTDAAQRTRGVTLTHETIRQRLESYVTDIAMLSLEDEAVREQKEKEINHSHSDFISSLFCQLFLSPQWTEDDRTFYEQLLLSPALEISDALVLVSAVMLSAINIYDCQKISTLVHLYQQASDERLRQRALVGWVFSIHSTTPVDEGLMNLLQHVFSDKTTARDLADMQKQVLFCIHAESDHETIQRDIMPTLMKNNNLILDSHGFFSEKEDDIMEDILEPDAADKRMEEVEDSIRQMMNMQKAGSDIYFGGFSQMKRYPFFYDLSNWFRPFTKSHPALYRITQKLKDSSFLDNVLNHAPFCESDKYSFALAMESVIERLPEQLKGMLNEKETLMPMGQAEENSGAAFIRRMYLQDLYRFFRLHYRRNDILNPFSSDEYVFMANPAYLQLGTNDYFADLCLFMRKHHHGDAFVKLASRYVKDDNAQNLLNYGIYLLLHQGDAIQAEAAFRQSLSLETDDERVLLWLARACFEKGDFKEACEHYETLCQRRPEHKSYAINMGVALSYAGRYDDAVKLFYKLDYEQPDSKKILRGLAWALMGAGKLEQAMGIYQRLLTADKVESVDFLNAGYCYWLMQNVEKAVDCFHQSQEKDSRQKPLSEQFHEDSNFLLSLGLTEVDILLMCDLVETTRTA